LTHRPRSPRGGCAEFLAHRASRAPCERLARIKESHRGAPHGPLWLTTTGFLKGVLMPPFLRLMLAVRPADAADRAGAKRLKQVLSAWSLTSIGLGATIGTGIFVLTGTVAAQHSGPAVTLSLLIAAFGSGLAALCYAEFATFLPVPGSAYCFVFVLFGVGFVWFFGWFLL